MNNNCPTYTSITYNTTLQYNHKIWHIYNRLPVLQISMVRPSSHDLVAASGQRRPVKPSGALCIMQSTTTRCTDCVMCPHAHMADAWAPQSFNVSPTRAVRFDRVVMQQAEECRQPEKEARSVSEWVSYAETQFLTLAKYSLAAASRPRLSETEPKLFVFETSSCAFCVRHCIESVASQSKREYNAV